MAAMLAFPNNRKKRNDLLKNSTQFATRPLTLGGSVVEWLEFRT